MTAAARPPQSPHGSRASSSGSTEPSCEDTLEIPLTPELLALATAPHDPGPALQPTCVDLLDSVASWPATRSTVGTFRLAPVRPARDLTLLARWMNDPAVAEYWGLAGEERRVRDHVEAQLSGDGRSVPCLGLLDGVPVSYWELYRADLDPLARSFPVRPHDTGVHLLLGPPEARGRGLGTVLLRAVAALVMEHRPACQRVLAEPDVRNVPSLAAFLGAGFRMAAEVALPEKTAAVMVYERRFGALR